LLQQIPSNRDLALNTISWLVQDENRITIRTKEEDSKPLFLTVNQLIWIATLLLILTALPVVMGILTAFRRR
ncbi:MAG: ABC transporter, partial [Candidatus Eremiobacterota bacterium]